VSTVQEDEGVPEYRLAEQYRMLGLSAMSTPEQTKQAAGLCTLLVPAIANRYPNELPD
jgi:hypothetical protein